MSVIATPTRPRWASTAGLRGLDPVLTVVTVLLLALVVVAVFAPLVAPYPPDQIDILQANQAPSSAHLLGTDSLGRDILSRLIFGARLTFLGPTLIIMLATFAGVVLTISAVWLGVLYDRIVSRGLDILFAIPGLLVAVIAVAVIGPGSSPPYSRWPSPTRPTSPVCCAAWPCVSGTSPTSRRASRWDCRAGRSAAGTCFPTSCRWSGRRRPWRSARRLSTYQPSPTSVSASSRPPLSGA